MTKDQKLAVLKRWQDAIEQSEATIRPVMAALKVDSESPVCLAVFQLQDELTTATADLVGDRDGWLDWYRSENAMGKRCTQACAAGQQMRHICTLEDLLSLVEAK